MGLDPFPQKQFPSDEASLDRLAESCDVRYGQIEKRELQSLSQRLDLVRVQLDVGSDRGLAELRVRRCHPIPANPMERCEKVSRMIEASGREIRPILLGKNLPVDFVVPIDIE